MSDSQEHLERLDVFANDPDQELAPDEIAEHLWFEERDERKRAELYGKSVSSERTESDVEG